MVCDINSENFTIQSLYSIENELMVHQTYSIIGLINFSFETYSIQQTTTEFPDGTGEVLTVKYNFHLTDCNIE